MGSAMLSMVACGAYKTVEDAASAIVKISETEEPDTELTRKYEKRYAEFRTIYPALKEVFGNLGGIND